MNFDGIEVLIEQSHEDGILIRGDVDRTEALAEFATGKQATAFNLKPANGTVLFFERIVFRLAGDREFEAEDLGGFVFGNFSRYTERLSG
jgi:hypothetical protein